MPQVILAPDSAHYPIDKTGSVNVVHAYGPQHTNPQSVQVGKADRTYAGRHVGFDDAPGVRPIVKRSHIHRHVRPRRLRNASDDRSDTRITVAKPNIAAIECRREWDFGSELGCGLEFLIGGAR